MTPTFHSFPRLPTELRLQIWELALHPRIISLPPSPTPSAPLSPPLPLLLHVNQEARAVGLRTLVPYALKSFGEGPTYLDLTHDTLFLEAGHTASSLRWVFSEPGLQTDLRFLALDWSIWTTVCDDGTYEAVFEDLMLLRRLKRITFVTTEDVFAEETRLKDGAEREFRYNEVVRFRDLGSRQEAADRDCDLWVEHSNMRPLRLGQWLQEEERGGWNCPEVDAKGVERVGRRWLTREERSARAAERGDAFEARRDELFLTSPYMSRMRDMFRAMDPSLP